MRAVVGLACFVAWRIYRADQDVRALRWGLAWGAYDLGAHLDAQRVIHGDITTREYLRRSDQRDRDLTTALR